MGYRDEMLNDMIIKDTWIDFNARNIAKQAVVCHTYGFSCEQLRK